MDIRKEVERIVSQYVDGDLRIVDGELVSDLNQATFTESVSDDGLPQRLADELVTLLDELITNEKGAFPKVKETMSVKHLEQLISEINKKLEAIGSERRLFVWVAYYVTYLIDKKHDEPPSMDDAIASSAQHKANSELFDDAKKFLAEQLTLAAKEL